MDNISTLLLVALLFAILCAVVISVAGSFRNPIVTVADEMHVPVPLESVDQAVVETLAAIIKTDTDLVLPGTYRVSYRHLPAYLLVLAVITFPLGLLFVVLGRQRLRLTIVLAEAQDGTRIKVLGRVHKKLAVAIGDALQFHFRREAGRVA